MKKTWEQIVKTINKNKEKDKILCIKTANKLQSDPYSRAGDTGRPGGGGEGEHALPPLTQFFHSKKKKGKEREKRKSFKTETIKNLSPRLKC